MRRSLLSGMLVVVAVGFCGGVEQAAAQGLLVDGELQAGSFTTLRGYHALQSVVTSPASGAIGNLGDVLVRWDLEVGATMSLVDRFANEAEGSLEGISGSPDRIETRTVNRLSAADEPELWLTSRSAVNFFADTDGDTNIVPFTWYNNGQASTDRVADLSGGGGLRIGGTLTQNQTFDLAEAFLSGEPLEPGDVVRIAPGSAQSVLRATGPGVGGVIGVVSTEPAIVMGGGAFSVEALRESWGSDVAEMFAAQRAELEAAAMAVPNGLLERKDSLAQRVIATPALDENGTDYQAIYERDLAKFQGDLETEALRVFFERNFARVALAGRVPVKVDSSYGAIKIGDYLTSSPTPGFAMKATGPGPVIGVALEDFAGGSGKIMTFVQRGWYGGEALNRARLQAEPGGGLVVEGSVVQASSRASKAALEPVSPTDFLNRVAELSISRWSYTADESAAPHVGPMAEDFHELFGVGSDSKHIALSDLSGVALAAIQGLHQQVQERDQRIQTLEDRLEALERLVARTEL
jgi:hypothetical protein